MKRAAFAIRAHSGWGALVAVAGNAGGVEVLKRCRITIVDGKIPGAAQPYHFAQEQTLPAAERHPAKGAASAEKLACEGLREVVNEVRHQKMEIAGCAILLASGRTLPELS